MISSLWNGRTLARAGALAAAIAAAPSVASGQTAEPTLDEMRAAAEKYRDIEVALAEGFVPDPTGMCVTAEMEGLPAEEGAMGIHYFRPDLLGITAIEPRVDGTGTHVDFLAPAILLYEPQADGSLELVAIENLVFEKAWQEAGHDGPPSLHGHPFTHMADDPETEFDEAHAFMPHFDQHVYLFRENPRGNLEPFNPAVTCEHATHAMPGAAEEAAGG